MQKEPMSGSNGDKASERMIMPVPVPLPLNPPIFLSNGELRDRVLFAKDFVLINGGLMRTAENPNSSDTVIHVPFLLFPSTFPRRLFNLATSIQPDFHTLIHQIALDRDFLYSTLKYIIETDSFTRRLWNLYEEIYANPEKSPRLYVGTTRNDYMLHRPKGTPSSSPCDLEIKQVEYNMTAISFGPLETVVGNYHKFLIGRLFGRETSAMHVDLNQTPNLPGVGLARTVVAAYHAYNSTYKTSDTCILIVADDPSRNIFDQRWIEVAMLESDPSVKTIRRTISQLRNVIDVGEVEKTGRLMVDSREIAAVYSRTGYNEGDYDFEAGDWELVRRPIELSRAAVTPCIAHQLANYKKVQQILVKPGQLERFGLSEESAERMRSTFTELMGLEFDADGEKAVEIGLSRPDDYVLKPMAEGGGHNYFGNEVAETLRQLRDKTERQNYVLMSLIRPPLSDNVSVAPGEAVDEPQFGRFSSELGIYGGFVVVDGHMVTNQNLGYVIRSKSEGVNESGLAAGFGRLDSAYFVD